MSTIINVNGKGRIVIPKNIRERAEIGTPGRLLLTIKGPGRIELVGIRKDLERAKRIASRKLKGWKEEEHKGEKLLLGIKD